MFGALISGLAPHLSSPFLLRVCNTKLLYELMLVPGRMKSLALLGGF